MFKNRSYLSEIPFLVITATIIFYFVVGFSILKPDNIAWLMNGDAATQYLGWAFFRNSDWAIPLGLNPKYGLEIATALIYSDSIPLLGFTFKILNPLMSETFQYFGLWILLCFILQAIFSWKLLGIFIDSQFVRFVGVQFFIFMPAFLFRIQCGHYSLLAHFLILAALLMIFSSKINHRSVNWGLIINCAALIHAYFLLMVIFLWLSDIADRKLFNKKYFLKNILPILLMLILTLWLTGYFSVSKGVVSGGYGFHRMNLWAPIDSDGWGLLPDLPSAKGEYEGFNYWGCGFIFLLLCVFFKLEKAYKNIFREKRYLLFVIVFFILFAMTNKVGIGLYEIDVSMPKFLINVANIFRSSGRFFWGVSYILLMLTLVAIFSIKNKAAKYSILLIGLAIQLIDLQPGLAKMTRHLDVPSSSSWNYQMNSKYWTEFPKRYSNIRILIPTNSPDNWERVAYLAQINKLGTDAVYFARFDGKKLQIAKNVAEESIGSGIYKSDSLYLFDKSLFSQIYAAANINTDLVEVIDGVGVIAPGWKK